MVRSPIAIALSLATMLVLACGSGGGGDPNTSDTGADACIPNCSGKQCGDDGCGGSCGTCGFGQTCNPILFQCVGGCVPDCTGKQCGDNGCGGSCGSCRGGQTCDNGICAVCNPDCAGKQCGDDGCDGSCGACDPGQQCVDGLCEGECTPNCSGKECGSDGCDGNCGFCNPDETCQGGQCVPTSSDVGTCKWYYECIFECPDNDEVCYQSCEEQLTQQGLQDTAAFQQCLQNHDCYGGTDDQFYQCLEDHCLLPYYKCFSGDTYSTCGQLVECIVACPSGDNACVGNCWSESTYQAQVGLQALLDCMDQACSQACTNPDSTACNDCWAQEQGQGGACYTEAMSCSY